MQEEVPREVDWDALDAAAPGYTQVHQAQGDGDAQLADQHTIDEGIALVIVVV